MSGQTHDKKFPLPTLFWHVKLKQITYSIGKRVRYLFALNYVLSFHKYIPIDEKVVQEANAYLDYILCRIYIRYLLLIHNVVSSSPYHELMV